MKKKKKKNSAFNFQLRESGVAAVQFFSFSLNGFYFDLHCNNAIAQGSVDARSLLSRARSN